MAELTPASQMMDFQQFGGTTILAPPSIPLQDLDSECLISLGIQSQSGAFLAYWLHMYLADELSVVALTDSTIDPHEVQPQLESRRRASQGNNHAPCQTQASVQLSQALAQQPESGFCRA